MDFGSLPVSDVRIVDRACDDFGRQPANGGRPRIEDYMNDASEPRRAALLRALLASELESRRARRASVPRGIPHRFPADADSSPPPSRSRLRSRLFRLRTGSLPGAGLLARGQSRWLLGARRLLAKRIGLCRCSPP